MFIQIVFLPANCEKIVANVVLPEIIKFLSEAGEKVVLLNIGKSCNDPALPNGACIFECITEQICK